MSRPQRILIVDDDDTNRALLEATLGSLGFESEMASDGPEAIERLNPGIDLVLLDVKMPGMDGFEVARRMRDHPQCGAVPIIMVTVLSSREDRLSAVAAGANDFITKPIDTTEVRLRVASLLRMKEALDRTAELKELTTTLSLEIEERKRAEEAARNSEQRYKSLYSMMRLMCDNVPDLIWAKDLEAKFIFVNRAMCQHLLNEPDPQQALGKTGLFFADRENRSHPDDPHWHTFGEICLNSDEVVTKSRKPQRCDESGNLKGEFVCLDVYKAPFWNERGEMIGTVGCGRVVTEEKRLDGERKGAEEELRQSEEKYRVVVEKAKDAILVVQDGMLRFANRQTVELLAYNETELLSKLFVDLVHPDERERVMARLSERLNGQKLPCQDTFRVLSGTGDVRWAEIESGVITWEHKPALLVFMSDITERRRMEAALIESEEWYRTLVQNSFDGLFVQKASRIVFANTRLYEMLGYSAGELEGLDHWVVYHEDYHSIVRERAGARMRGENAIAQYEVVLQRKDGSHFDGEVSARALTVHGEPGVQVWVRDISSRRRAEEAQRRLATAVEQAAEAIVVTDTQGVIQYVNPAFGRVSGYTDVEVLGSNPRILKSGEHDALFYKNLWDTITAGKVWTGRLINRRKDGSIFHEDTTISPVRDSHGNLVNFVAVKRDMTQHIELSKQLFQAQKMEAIGTLAGGIAHDFNNLLQITLGYSELLLAEKITEDQEFADLQKIHRAAQHGAELVRGLLTFSRKVESKAIPMNLNRQIEMVESLLRRTIPKMIDIELDLSKDLREINADPSQMEQLLMNLALNARDAMPDGGILTLRTKNEWLKDKCCGSHAGAEAGYCVVLTVSDTGHGMDGETVDHIFEPFYTTKEVGKGTGLGLAVVYGIVEQHGGRISCSSETGKGTTFEIRLPAMTGTAELEGEQTGIISAHGKETILLVDDDDLVRELGSRMLNTAGYTVLQAANGRQALDVVQTEQGSISLVVLDLIMPKMGGANVLRELRRDYPQVKVVVASGYSGGASIEESLEAGATGFVSKPFQMKELLRAVRKALDEG